MLKTILCQCDMQGATTMSYTDKKQTVKLLSYMSTFDGGLYRRGNNNAAFIMNMVKDNLDYVQWVDEVLNRVTSTRLNDRKDYNTDGYIRKQQVRLESRNHPLLTKLHDRIYIDRRKVIDPHMLKMMDAEALAIIFMCDGHSSLDLRFKNPHKSIGLSTKGFSYGDNWLLKKSIKEKLNLEFNINRHGKYYYLHLRVKDHEKFISMILPFMKDSFLYKLERIAPAIRDDDIVCTMRKRIESYRNDKTLQNEE